MSSDWDIYLIIIYGRLLDKLGVKDINVYVIPMEEIQYPGS